MAEKPLTERIADASRELKLARRDGTAEWIQKATAKLDKLVDELPRPDKTGMFKKQPMEV